MHVWCVKAQKDEFQMMVAWLNWNDNSVEHSNFLFLFWDLFITLGLIILSLLIFGFIQLVHIVTAYTWFSIPKYNSNIITTILYDSKWKKKKKSLGVLVIRGYQKILWLQKYLYYKSIRLSLEFEIEVENLDSTMISCSGSSKI